MFDYLGFQEIARSLRIRDLVYNYHTVIDTFLGIHARPDHLSPQKREPAVSAIRFADSVILDSGGDDAAAFGRLVRASAHFAATSIGLGMLVRGGIARGDVVMDRAAGLFLGEGILLAHQAECAQQWAGASLHQDAVVPEQAIDNLERQGYLSRSAIPTKKGPRSGWALGWPRALSGDEAAIRRRLVHLCRPSTQDAREKHENTLRFFKEHRQKFPEIEAASKSGVELGFENGNWLPMPEDKLAFIVWSEEVGP